MLNQQTRQVLSQLGAINNSMIISYPVTGVKMGKNMQAFLNVENLGEEPFEEIGVYSIAELNSVINVIDNAEITNTNGVLNISNETSSIKYGTTSIDIIESECRLDFSFVDRIKSNELISEFNVSAKELDKIKKMSGLLKDLSDLEIEIGTDNVVNLRVKSKEKSSNNYTVRIDAESTVKEEIKMLLSMGSINKLPNSEFKFNIYRSKKGSLVAFLESVNVEGMSVIVAAKA